MKRFAALSILALIFMMLLCRVGLEVGIQLASADDSGSQIAAPAPPAAAPTMHDPAQDPTAAVTDVRGAFKTFGAYGAALLGAYYFVELLALVGKKKSIASLAWLGQGRVSVVLAGAGIVLAAMTKALFMGAGWGAVGIAGMTAGLAFWHPAGTASSSS